MPRWANLKRVECPILLRATPQPSTGRRSVRSTANPVRRQGILETTHRHPKPYEHKQSRSHEHHHSGQSGARLESVLNRCPLNVGGCDELLGHSVLDRIFFALLRLALLSDLNACGLPS